MNIFIAVLAAIIGYLLGSISVARIMARLFLPGEDITTTTLQIPGADDKFEMTSVSATSLSLREGPRIGCTTSILDMLKVALPTLAFRLLFPETSAYFLIAAGAGVLGHNFPIYHRFVGGRGITAVWGGLFVIDWLAVPITTVLGTILGLAAKDVLLAYSGGILLLIPLMWLRFQSWEFVAYALFVNGMYWWAMWPDLVKYLEFKRAGKADDMIAVLEQTDMGRGLKYMRKYGLIKDKKEDA
ncbi:glycerol-3-phosphate acyltransferase [Candidatus Leptofilum sp.]|uniref:glycerol-3-phosphate acyltransferase n=1 Tax=Candidatus Leptofilum sp. TaxID=3241576 RepID=UPI003B59E55D